MSVNLIEDEFDSFIEEVTQALKFYKPVSL